MGVAAVTVIIAYTFAFCRVCKGYDHTSYSVRLRTRLRKQREEEDRHQIILDDTDDDFRRVDSTTFKKNPSSYAPPQMVVNFEGS